MGKQPRVLEHIADPAALHRHADTGLGIHQHGAIQLYESLVGLEQSRDEVDERGLTAPGTPEQRDDARSGHFELRAQGESVPPFEKLRLQHSSNFRHQRPRNRRTRRVNSSDSHSPMRPSAMDMAASLAAGESPVGDCMAV